MIKINRLSDYAVVLLAQCAAFGDQAATTTILSEQTQIALPVVRKLMQQLRDANLVEATQGHRGGYVLTKPLDQIYLL
jgi:DNA-binding IscR family transcriptional regulator